jgi:hypothetical protein
MGALIPIPEPLASECASSRAICASMAIVQPYEHMHLEDIAKEAGVLKDWEERRQ